jgi:hypothetical protein
MPSAKQLYATNTFNGKLHVLTQEEAQVHDVHVANIEHHVTACI